MSETGYKKKTKIKEKLSSSGQFLKRIIKPTTKMEKITPIMICISCYTSHASITSLIAINLIIRLFGVLCVITKQKEKKLQTVIHSSSTKIYHPNNECTYKLPTKWKESIFLPLDNIWVIILLVGAGGHVKWLEKKKITKEMNEHNQRKKEEGKRNE